MNKYFLYLILFIIFNQCSLDTKTGFWTKPEILKEKKENLVEIFKTEEVLEKEFNPNLKIKINSLYTQKPFINNLTNNSGYINFESNLNEISKFKFKKIKNFNFINPDLLIGNDNSLIFFDKKGTILKFNENSKLMWKKNHYDKIEKKQQPLIYFATDNKVLIAADSIANLYAVDYANGNLLWKTFNTASWIYYGRVAEGGRFLPKKGLPIKVPTAVALFPKEYLEWAPRSYVERIYNIKQWTDMPKGGHFAALEQPELLINDIRKFSNNLK